MLPNTSYPDTSPVGVALKAAEVQIRLQHKLKTVAQRTVLIFKAMSACGARVLISLMPLDRCLPKRILLSFFKSLCKFVPVQQNLHVERENIFLQHMVSQSKV